MKRTRKEKRTENVKSLASNILSGAGTGFGLGYYSTQLRGVNATPSKRIIDSAKKGHYGKFAGGGYAKKIKELANKPMKDNPLFDPIHKNDYIISVAQRRGALLGGLAGAGYTGYNLYKNRSKK
jgi:hypothetical protein